MGESEMWDPCLSCHLFSQPQPLFLCELPWACPFLLIPQDLRYGTAPGGSVCRRPWGAALAGLDVTAGEVSFYPSSLLPSCSARRKLEVLGFQQAANGTLRFGSLGVSLIKGLFESHGGCREATKGRSPHLNIKKEL